MTMTSTTRVLLATLALYPLLTGGTIAMAKEKSDERLEHALEVQERHQSKLNRIPGVSGTAVGPSANGSGVVIHVYVDPGTSDENKRKIPKKLDGHPVEIVEAPPNMPQ